METWLLILLGILLTGIITSAIVVPVVLIRKHKEKRKVKKEVKKVHKKPLTKEEEKMFNSIMKYLDTEYKNKWKKSLPKSELKKIALCAIEQVESRAGGLDIANNYLAKFGMNKTAESNKAEMCDILYNCGFVDSPNPNKCVPLKKPGVKPPPPPPPIIEIKHPLIDCTKTQNSCWQNVSPRNKPCIIPNAFCNYKAGKCAECNTDEDCVTATKRVPWSECITTFFTRCNNNKCVQCNKDSDCPIEGQLCRNNKCTECSDDSDCTSPAKCLQLKLHEFQSYRGLPFETTQINVCRFCIDSRQCSNHGICVSQQTACECIPGWEGERCERKSGKPIQCRTRSDCSNHGNCIDAKCNCESGWTGTYCQTKK